MKERENGCQMRAVDPRINSRDPGPVCPHTDVNGFSGLGLSVEQHGEQRQTECKAVPVSKVDVTLGEQEAAFPDFANTSLQVGLPDLSSAAKGLRLPFSTTADPCPSLLFTTTGAARVRRQARTAPGTLTTS